MSWGSSAMGKTVLDKMEPEVVLHSRETILGLAGEALASIAISQKRLADAAEHQAVSLKRIADSLELANPQEFLNNLGNTIYQALVGRH